MVIAIFLSIIIISILSYITIAKKLTSLESIYLWMINSFLLTTWFDILASNLHTIQIGNTLPKTIIVRFIIITTFPILILTYVNILLSISNIILRVVCYSGHVMLLVLLEQILRKSGYLLYITRNIEDSMIGWSLYVLIIPIFLIPFRKELKKEIELE